MKWHHMKIILPDEYELGSNPSWRLRSRLQYRHVRMPSSKRRSGSRLLSSSTVSVSRDWRSSHSKSWERGKLWYSLQISHGMQNHHREILYLLTTIWYHYVVDDDNGSMTAWYHILDCSAKKDTFCADRERLLRESSQKSQRMLSISPYYYYCTYYGTVILLYQNREIWSLQYSNIKYENMEHVSWFDGVLKCNIPCRRKCRLRISTEKWHWALKWTSLADNYGRKQLVIFTNGWFGSLYTY